MADDDIRVETESLESDAAAWECVGVKADTLSEAASDLTLSALDFHPRAAGYVQAHQRYVELLEVLTAQLVALSGSTLNASDALRSVKGAYEESERASDDLAQQLMREL